MSNFAIVPSVTPFVQSETFISLILGPVGCLAGDTLVITENGPTPIAEIKTPVRVLSWNEMTHQYQLSQATVAFPKDTGYLYRVVTEQGEFDAAESHLLLCADNEYRRVSELQVGDVLKTYSSAPAQTTAGSFQQEYTSGEKHCSQIGEGYQDGYVTSDRLYGLLSLCLKEGVLAFAPLHSDARTYTQLIYQTEISQLSDLQAELSVRTHSELCAYLKQTGDFPTHTDHLRLDEACRIFVESFGYGEGSSQALEQLQSKTYSQKLTHEPVKLTQDLVLAFDSPSLITTDRSIVSLTRKQVKEVYWDIQVEGTHNYVTVDGAIHHNSTKTTGGIAKIAYHAAKMAPCKDGKRRSRAIWIRNTREQLRDTSIPDFLKWYPDGEYGMYLKTEYKFTLEFDDVICEVLFRGLDDANDVRRLLSLQASFAILDEFREIHPDIYNTVQGRLGRYPDRIMNGVGCVTDDGEQNSHLWGMSNPPDIDSFWEDLLTNPPENVHVTIQPGGLSPEADWLHCLPDGYYDNLAKGKTEDWIDVYINTQFGKSLSGKPVFRSFNRETHVSKTALRPTLYSVNPILVGFDCTGLGPAAVVGQLGAGGKLYIYDCMWAEDMGPIRFIREVLMPMLTNKYSGSKVLVIIDPAGMARGNDEKNVADMLTTAGLAVIPASTNGIAARISAVEHYLTRMVDGNPGIMIDGVNAFPLIQALSGKYRFKINTKGDVADTPDKVRPWADLCDALQYLCLHADGGAIFGKLLGGIKRRAVTAVSAGGWT